MKRETHSPTYAEEANLLDLGHSIVAGLDEVGRGPLAGPVVAGVVILPHYPSGKWLELIRDSKQLTSNQRTEANKHIRDKAIAFELGSVSSYEIDKIGIVRATQLAMRRAIDSLVISPQYLLVDAINIPDIDTPQKAIIKGDALCYSIAAASIIAKVNRDEFMETAGDEFPGYGFAGNKGYGTKEHLEALKELGPCPIHRFSFAPIKTN